MKLGIAVVAIEPAATNYPSSLTVQVLLQLSVGMAVSGIMLRKLEF
ncbi:hypothetical protein Cri9333_0277 [Crinalium epipsammum PCC 9333]|uniref:Uncharacterized protein n=1 Tax=Crinalium epipsammum PCC 9333 TaxID=1173022 RepID=K9VUM4_9CYAN|nr:hypothetical protein [Crinalium epipsammum]AFZ11264.1 hypothetical protein Cri9333_0277 [Crinalium epipsammum PCC 9333]